MVHPLAVVHEEARLGPEVRVEPFAVIEEGVEVGRGSTIRSHAVLRRGTVLGERVLVDSGAVVGGDPNHLEFDPAVRSGVRVGDGVTLREHVTVHRSVEEGGATVVDREAFLMTHVHVGHDCRVGERVIIAAHAGLSGHVEVDEGAFIGGLAGIHQFVRIGAGAMVGGVARIRADVAPYTMVAEEDRLVGLNRVGLRRSGVDAAALSELRSLFREILGSPGSPHEKANGAPAPRSEEARRFLSFFVPNQRGYARRIRT